MPRASWTRAAQRPSSQSRPAASTYPASPVRCQTAPSTRNLLSSSPRPPTYPCKTCAPLTTISPGSPAGRQRALSSAADSGSMGVPHASRRMRNSISGTGFPASSPLPPSIAGTSASVSSARAICAIGSASVEPYTATACPAGATTANASSSRGNTGAPPAYTKRSCGRVMLRAWQCATMHSQNAGEAPARRGRWRAIWPITGSASIRPGCRRSPAAIRLVTPEARSASTKIGKVVRLTLPGAAGKVCSSTRCCASRKP